MKDIYVSKKGVIKADEMDWECGVVIQSTRSRLSCKDDVDYRG
jgi:hypothetical protein